MALQALWHFLLFCWSGTVEEVGAFTRTRATREQSKRVEEQVHDLDLELRNLT